MSQSLPIARQQRTTVGLPLIFLFFFTISLGQLGQIAETAFNSLWDTVTAKQIFAIKPETTHFVEHLKDTGVDGIAKF